MSKNPLPSDQEKRLRLAAEEERLQRARAAQGLKKSRRWRHKAVVYIKGAHQIALESMPEAGWKRFVLYGVFLVLILILGYLLASIALIASLLSASVALLAAFLAWLAATFTFMAPVIAFGTWLTTAAIGLFTVGLTMLSAFMLSLIALFSSWTAGLIAWAGGNAIGAFFLQIHALLWPMASKIAPFFSIGNNSNRVVKWYQKLRRRSEQILEAETQTKKRGYGFNEKELFELSQKLQKLEEQLLSPRVRKNKNQLQKLLSEDFYEVGASGNTYTLKDILERLPQETGKTTLTLSHFSLTPYANHLVQTRFLLTRTQADASKIQSARMSLWRFEKDGHWRMTYHQGTPLAPAAPRGIKASTPTSPPTTSQKKRQTSTIKKAAQ